MNDLSPNQVSHEEWERLQDISVYRFSNVHEKLEQNGFKKLFLEAYQKNPKKVHTLPVHDEALQKGSLQVLCCNNNIYIEGVLETSLSQKEEFTIESVVSEPNKQTDLNYRTLSYSLKDLGVSSSQSKCIKSIIMNNENGEKLGNDTKEKILEILG